MILEVFALVVLLVLFATALFGIWFAGSFPGKIARSRRHEHSDAVAIAGWCSLLMFLPFWPLALVWAYTGADAGARASSSDEVAEQ